MFSNGKLPLFSFSRSHSIIFRRWAQINIYKSMFFLIPSFYYAIYCPDYYYNLITLLYGFRASSCSLDRDNMGQDA